MTPSVYGGNRHKKRIERAGLPERASEWVPVVGGVVAGAVWCSAKTAVAGMKRSDCANVREWLESVAQLVEHRPFKALVLGSSPSALTI